VGRCPTPLSALAVRPGQRLGLLACLEGDMRADFPFFRSFDPRGERLGGDVRLLAELADAGHLLAAKDVSMAGLVGSLAMLLEPTGAGVTIDIGDVPRPAGVDLGQWLITFPCFAFLVCPSEDGEDACREAAERRDLTYAALGVVDASGEIVLGDGPDRRTVIDLTAEPVTGLRSPGPPDPGG
jgi:selenophosphate synthetase-related protein